MLSAPFASTAVNLAQAARGQGQTPAGAPEHMLPGVCIHGWLLSMSYQPKRADKTCVCFVLRDHAGLGRHLRRGFANRYPEGIRRIDGRL